MRRLLAIVLLLCLVAPVRPVSQAVVLVVRADSPLQELDSVSVRKLFLGLPVLINGSPLHPLRNRSDPVLDEIFLQQIVAMSQSNYDRQILIGVNRQGWLRPTEYGRLSDLVAALEADPYAVSFMWERDVGHNPKLRVIRVLWSD
ncbi:MAG TPA: hypothetical protein VGN03_12790 [Steroidobacteraceae bacterium]